MTLLNLMGFGPKIVYGGDSGGGGGGGGGNDNDNTPAPTNSFTESIANFFTPNDGASYVGGQLVDDDTGASISAGGTTSTGNVISGSANDDTNDIQGPMPAGINFPNSPVAVTPAPVVQPLGTLENITTTSTPAVVTTGTSGALPATNSTMEELANLMTPNDGAVYANGQLIDQFTGEVIEAGGLSSTGDTI